jgi:8-oxo-dGTP diphosphatase
MVDLMFRVAYRCAYRLMRVYWGTVHPNTHGALVAVWWQGQILLVRNSYVPYHSLPGGYVRPWESGTQAAVRELKEETGLDARPEQLRRAVDLVHDWEGKHDHVEIFELDASEPPRVKVDNREVVAAEFFTPDVALTLNLFPPIRDAIRHHLARRN